MKKLQKNGEKRDYQSKERLERVERPVPRKRKKQKKPGKRKIFFKRERVSFCSRSNKFRPAHISSDSHPINF